MLRLGLLAILLFARRVVSLAGTCPREPKSFRVAFLADTHVGYGLWKDCPTNQTVNMQVNVDRLNAQARLDPDLAFVFILGDIGHWYFHVEAAANLLHDLDLPWAPLLGNHDCSHAYSNPSSLGAGTFIDFFGPQIRSLVTDGFARHLTMDSPVQPPGREDSIRLVNYEVRLPGLENEVAFLALDTIQRTDINAPDLDVERSFAGEFRFHDFEGGMYPWLQSRLTDLLSSSVKKIILLQHHQLKPYPAGWHDRPPPTNARLFMEPDDWLTYANLLITSMDAAGDTQHKRITGALGGHTHYPRDHFPFGDTTMEQPVTPPSGLETFREIIVDDSKCEPMFAVVEFRMDSDDVNLYENSFPPLDSPDIEYCSGHGRCLGELCECDSGWQGSECQSSGAVDENGVDSESGMPAVLIGVIGGISGFVLMVVLIVVVVWVGAVCWVRRGKGSGENRIAGDDGLRVPLNDVDVEDGMEGKKRTKKRPPRPPARPQRPPVDSGRRRWAPPPPPPPSRPVMRQWN